jgi:cytochrome c oxidase cbb3-type subunit I/II
MNTKRLIEQTLIALAVVGVIFISAQTRAAEKEHALPIQVSPYTGRPPVTPQTIAEGKEIYDGACVYCHGRSGEGKGPVAYFLSRDTAPHPRDFTSGVFKFRSTPSGELPLDEDLFRTVTDGIAGFMPNFVGLTPSDRWKVVYFIKTYYPEFKDAKPEAIKVAGGPVPFTAASVQHGYEVFQQFKCWECHGGNGLGNGHKAPDLKDDWGFPLPPANLTRPSSFKNGDQPADIFRTIMTGLDGGAMASYADSFAGRERDAWDLVNFILSLSQERR